MIRSENAKHEETPVRGYVENVASGAAPKYSIYDPSRRSRTWLIGPGQKTGVITILESSALYKWIRSKEDLRFVRVADEGVVGGGRLAAPIPTPTKPKPPRENKGKITHMGDTMPTITPKDMVGQVKGAELDHTPPEEAGVKHMGKVMPDKTPKELLGGSPKRIKQDKSEPIIPVTKGSLDKEAKAKKPIVIEPPAPVVVPEPEPIAPPSPVEPEIKPFDTGLLDEMGYQELKSLMIENDIPLPKARNAKALHNTILMYLEEHPGCQLKM